MRTCESNLPVCNAQEIPLFIDCEGKELGKVNVLELSWKPNTIARNTELIVCLDVSAGMHGDPIKRAKETIVQFRNDLMRDGCLTIAQTVTFAEGIKYHDMFCDDFVDQIAKIEAEGKINYLTLFRCLKDYIRTAEQTNVCVVFLSCGPNVYGSMRDMELALNVLYEACSGKLVEFHTIGFGPENDVNLLRILSRIGSGGSYQYCENENNLNEIIMGLKSAITYSGYSAELVSPEGVSNKLLRCYDFREIAVENNSVEKPVLNSIKFRLYGVDSSILNGTAKYDIVLKTSKGKLVFALYDALRKDQKAAIHEYTSQRIELLYLQCSSYAQQLSRRLPKNIILEHNQQFSKFVYTAKDIYDKIMSFDTYSKRFCLFSMIRLFDYLSTYYSCLCKLKNSEEDLTFADLSILHSKTVFVPSWNIKDIEKITLEFEQSIVTNVTTGQNCKTNCLCFTRKSDPFVVDSESFLDTLLFAEDLAKYADLFGLQVSLNCVTRSTFIPLYINEEHWLVARERRKMINCLTSLTDLKDLKDPNDLADLPNPKNSSKITPKFCNSEFSLLSKLMHKMVELLSVDTSNSAKLLECEKSYKLLLETCAALLRDDENEIKLVKHIFENYTNPGSLVRLQEYVPCNEVFLMKLFVAFYAKIIPIEKSENFVDKLNLLCLFMFEEEMRKLLKNIPYISRNYLWQMLNIDPAIYSVKLDEIMKSKNSIKLGQKFGFHDFNAIVRGGELFSEVRTVECGTENSTEKNTENNTAEPSNKEHLSFDSILSFNFSNELQKHIDRFNIPEQIRDLMNINSPSYQFILDFMSMCTGNTISTENNFGICSLAILLQNILHVNDRSKAVCNSDFAAAKNPEDIGFGTPYMFKVVTKASGDYSPESNVEFSNGLVKDSVENSPKNSVEGSPKKPDSQPPATLDTYIDMVSIGCYDRAQLYLVFLLTQKCIEFLDKKRNDLDNKTNFCSTKESIKVFANCGDLFTAIEMLDGCKFGSDFSKYLDSLLSGCTSLTLDKLCLLVFGGFFFRVENATEPQYKFAQLIDDIPSDRKIVVKGLKVTAWKPSGQNIYKIWAKLGHLAPKEWWLQLFSHNKHAIECRYTAE